VQPNGEGLAPLALKEANITVVLERGADASSAETATPPGQTQDADLSQVLPTFSESAAPAPAPATAQGGIAVGSVVRIDGVKAKPELNGKVATVAERNESRWVVTPHEDGLDTVALKEANVTLLLTAEEAAASTAVPTVTAAVAVGCTVLIDGLKSKPELNGMKGVVTARKEPRWVVQPNGEGLAPLALKEANITVVAPAPAPAPTVQGGSGCCNEGVCSTDTAAAPAAAAPVNASTPTQADDCSGGDGASSCGAADTSKPSSAAAANGPVPVADPAISGAEKGSADYSEYKPDWKPKGGAGAGAGRGKKAGGLDEFLSQHGSGTKAGPSGRKKQKKVAGFRKQEEFGAKKFIKP